MKINTALTRQMLSGALIALGFVAGHFTHPLAPLGITGAALLWIAVTVMDCFAETDADWDNRHLKWANADKTRLEERCERLDTENTQLRADRADAWNQLRQIREITQEE